MSAIELPHEDSRGALETIVYWWSRPRASVSNSIATGDCNMTARFRKAEVGLR